MLDAHTAHPGRGSRGRAEAAAWYEKERAGLGVDFTDAIEAALDVLEQDVAPLTSLTGTAGARGAKRLVLRRFPIGHCSRERNLVVVPFAHHSRRPGYWRDRLRS